MKYLAAIILFLSAIPAGAEDKGVQVFAIPLEKLEYVPGKPVSMRTIPEHVKQLQVLEKLVGPTPSYVELAPAEFAYLSALSRSLGGMKILAASEKILLATPVEVDSHRPEFSDNVRDFVTLRSAARTCDVGKQASLTRADDEARHYGFVYLDCPKAKPEYVAAVVIAFERGIPNKIFVTQPVPVFTKALEKTPLEDQPNG